jgi:hypothetical protein
MPFDDRNQTFFLPQTFFGRGITTICPNVQTQQI